MNVCTPSHATDAHIKVWYFATRKNPELGRCIVRLVVHKRRPMMLIEDIYATSWSDEHTEAFVLALIRKAMRISRETEGPVYLAIAVWRKRSVCKEIFARIAKRFDGKIKRHTFSPKVGPSINEVQYSDSLGGKIWNGEKQPSSSLHTLVIDVDAEEQAA
jgi:hypothetical protein